MKRHNVARRRVSRATPHAVAVADTLHRSETEPPRFVVQAAVVFVVALVLRLVHVWQIRQSPFFDVLMGDARGYDAWAQRIAGGEWIGGEVFYQAPLYPYFLGVIYASAGRDLMLVRIVQAVVGSGACVLLAVAAHRLFSRRVGLVAGLALAVYAPAIFFDGILQKAVLDVFFICLGIWLLSEIIAESTGRVHQLRPYVAWLALGLTMGALALTRENALALVAVVFGWTLFRRSSSRSGRRAEPTTARSRVIAAYGLGLAIVLLPVGLRNYAVGGGLYLTTSQFGPNFYIGNSPGADGTYASLRFGRGAPEYERQDATDLAERAMGRRLTPTEVSSYWTDRALDFITTQPGAWVRLLARKFVLLWNADEMLDTESQESYAEWSMPVRVGAWFGHFGVLVPLALFGLWSTWPERHRLGIFHALTATYAATVVLFYVFARYRFPLVPFLVLFAGAGLVSLAESRLTLARRSGASAALAQDTSNGDTHPHQRAADRKPRAIAVVVVAAVIFSNWPLLSPNLMRAITENNLGTALFENNRTDEALRHYRRAIELDPNYAPAYNNLGAALRSTGDLDQAMATYERALGVQPDYPDAHYNLANALLEKNEPERAAEHFRRALAVIPGSAHVHNNLGIALAEKGRLEDAVAEFRQALAADPSSALAHKNLGSALASLGQGSEAVAHLRRAAQLTPGDGAVRYDLGSVFLEFGALDEAVTELGLAVELMPDSPVAHNNLGIALGSQGRLEEAIQHFRRALELEPGFADAEENLQLALKAKK